jgi:hypothetical protein
MHGQLICSEPMYALVLILSSYELFILLVILMLQFIFVHCVLCIKNVVCSLYSAYTSVTLYNIYMHRYIQRGNMVFLPPV